mmetsp:Transcript_3631/g.7970  ORF Transcript_3631/g.7970 Transcript_3631/m.7970 type:complete len:80 (-) Transcript_3631:256-495(-)|eukprot:CAMPEP_0172184262 /NCGR_PEP_ID=MMETSP1050-20130122/19469_1 /TAXON_ID=233186 /ORGANISM="Cryptomonas curvata, Strain CCAP979/52" /LENGTH=79 /DNA_ID=CAMNT_0012858023 /DNA_START=220 /DNA_END=459 /DNA_ORIENTATION=-
MARVAMRNAESARKAHQDHKPRPSILKRFKDYMNLDAKNRHYGLKEARSALDAARAAALCADNTSDDDLISDNDDMKVN